MRRNIKRSLLTFAALPVIAFAPPQSDAQTPPANSGWELFQGAPKFKDENGNTLKVRGRILWDIAALEEESGNVTTSIDENEFRAARIGLEGQYDAMKFKFEVDFAGSDIEVKDAFFTLKKVANTGLDLTVGQQKTPNSLEEMESSRHTNFMERAAFTDAFGLDRRVGATLSKGGNNYSMSGGVFGTSISAMNDDKSSNTVWAARGSYAPVADAGNIIHFGGSVRYVDEDNTGAPKRSSRWGSHQASEKVKPNIGASATLFGLEAATSQGPFHAQAEYMQENGDNGDANGYYASAGYFLTGETRKYKGNVGYFDRTKPKNPLSKGGLGGFQLVARYDVIDAANAGGQESSAAAVGLVWYPESHLRFRFEAISADADTYDASGFQMRTQIDW